MDKSTEQAPRWRALHCTDHTSMNMAIVRVENKTGAHEIVYTGPQPVFMVTRMMFGDPDVDKKPLMLDALISEN